MCERCDKGGLWTYCQDSAELKANPVDEMVSLQAVRACIEFMLREIQKFPDDSLRDIAHEAFEQNKIPLTVFSDYYEPHKDNTYFVSVDKNSEFLAG